jgi:hypothetical protein
MKLVLSSELLTLRYIVNNTMSRKGTEVGDLFFTTAIALYKVLKELRGFKVA